MLEPPSMRMIPMKSPTSTWHQRLARERRTALDELLVNGDGWRLALNDLHDVRDTWDEHVRGSKVRTFIPRYLVRKSALAACTAAGIGCPKMVSSPKLCILDARRLRAR